MDGYIQQIISLVSFGNYALAGNKTEFPRGYSPCKTIAFVRIESQKEEVIAKNFSEWIEYLKAHNKTHLQLYYTRANPEDISGPMTDDSQTGGERWLIAALGGQKADVWEGWLESVDQADEAGEVWSAKYGQVSNFRLPHVNKKTLSEVYDEFRNAVTEIFDFANAQQVQQSWINSFSRALQCFEQQDPSAKNLFLKDLIPCDAFDLKAQQILAAAEFCNIFGGMGSWTDMGFQGSIQQEYEKVTENLFLAMTEAIVSAVNSYPSLNSLDEPIKV